MEFLEVVIFVSNKGPICISLKLKTRLKQRAYNKKITGQTDIRNIYQSQYIIKFFKKMLILAGLEPAIP